MSAWFDWYPDRLDAELKAFKRHKIDVEIDEERKSQGKLVLSLRYSYGDKDYRLRAHYPDLYPFFVADVFAPDEQFARHQHPTSKHLCLTGRRTSAWHSDEMLADVINDRLPAIIDYHNTRDQNNIQSVEAKQGEPVSEYFNADGLSDSYMLFDSSWVIPNDIKRGSIRIRYRQVNSKLITTGEPQGYFEKVLDDKGSEICSWNGPRPNSINKAVTIRWVRIEPPPIGYYKDIDDRLSDDDKVWLGLKNGLPSNGQPAFYAVLFSEEILQFGFADGWAMVQRWIQHRGKQAKQIAAMVRTFRAGDDDLAARMPAVTPFREKSVTFVGLGALGSFAALELARTGINQIHLIDGDYVEPGTIRRWVGGWSAFGRPKADEITARITSDYPWTEAIPHKMKIGAPSASDIKSQFHELTELIGESDLVIDLSAELGVNHALSELCRIANKPYIVANATPGAWGGLVAQFVHGKEHSCWMCLREFLYGSSNSELPLADPEGELQPPGCGARTFTGAAFDLEEISLEVVRTAAGLLSGGAYPSTTWQLGMLNLRVEGGERRAPCWAPFDIPRREGCKCLDI